VAPLTGGVLVPAGVASGAQPSDNSASEAAMAASCRSRLFADFSLQDLTGRSTRFSGLARQIRW